jgi:hypothetical protein
MRAKLWVIGKLIFQCLNILLDVFIADHEDSIPDKSREHQINEICLLKSFLYHFWGWNGVEMGLTSPQCPLKVRHQLFQLLLSYLTCYK